jgi:hypothetical protein
VEQNYAKFGIEFWNAQKMKKTELNNFGITYSSVAKEPFFRDLDRPATKAEKQKFARAMTGVKNVAVKFVAPGC